MTTIGTLHGAGHPYSIAARLLTCADVRPFVLGADWSHDPCLFACQALILGDLPGPPQDDRTLSALHDWVKSGGRLLYFTGWKDHRVIAANPSLFGFRLPSTPRLHGPPLSVCWSPSQPNCPPPPPLRFTSTVEDCSAATLASLPDGSPVILSHDIGRGRVVTVLGPITFPAGGDWVLSAAFPDTVAQLLGHASHSSVDHDPARLDSTHFGLQCYSEILEALVDRNPTLALRLLFGALTEIASRNRTLACELCQVARRVAMQNGNVGATLYSTDYLLDNWERLSSQFAYDYAPSQRAWFAMTQAVDRALLTTGLLGPRLDQAIAARATHIAARPSAIELGEEQDLDGIGNFLGGVRAIAKATEETEHPLEIIECFDEAERLLELASRAPFSSPKTRATLAYVRLSASMARGLLGATATAQVRTEQLDALEKEARIFADLPDEGWVTITVKSVRHFLSLIAKDREGQAWTALAGASDPFARSVFHALLRLRHAMQADPLSMVAAFRQTSEESRVRISRKLEELARARVEGEASTIRLVFGSAADKRRSSLLPGSLLGESAVPQLVSASRTWPVMHISYDGEVTGIPLTAGGGYTRDRVETREAATARSAGGASTAVVEVFGWRHRIDVSMPDGSGVCWAGGVWRANTSLNVATVRMREYCATDEEARALVALLGDLKDMALGTGHFHGAAIVVGVDALPSDDGTAITPYFALDGASVEELAGLFQRDGATFISLCDRTVRRVGVQLRASEGSMASALKSNRWLEQHGTRHKSCVSFSVEHPPASVFLVSADGPCLAAKAGRVWRVW